MSRFDHLKPVAPSSISKIVRKYIADTSKNKIDLASGGKYKLCLLMLRLDLVMLMS